MLKNFFFSLSILFCAFTLSAQDNFPTPELINLDQKAVSLTDYVGNGKPTVVAIWATWCQPCHMELDEMKAYLKKWEGDYGAQVLAISVDKRHMFSRIKPLVSRKGWEYQVLVDPDGAIQSALGFNSIPQMYILNGAGKIVDYFSGFESGRGAEVDRLIKKLATK